MVKVKGHTNAEDMLRAVLIDFGNSWDLIFHARVLTYTIVIHAFIKAAPYELCYERKLCSPVCWTVRLEVSQYQRWSLKVGDMVLLKVSPWKGAVRFRKRGKLSPRYIRPFKIVARVGLVAYTLELLKKSKGIHLLSCSNLKKVLAEVMV
ncbi:hypothetical protein Tco_0662936 [Tanacetum coccineum]